LTFLNAAVLGLILVTAGLAQHWQVDSTLRGKLDASLLAIAETEIASSTDTPHGPAHLHPIRPFEVTEDIARLDKIVLLVDRQDRIVAERVAIPSLRFDLPSDFSKAIREWGAAFRTVPSHAGDRIRIVGLPMHGRRTEGMVLIVGTSLRSLDDLLTVLDLALIGIAVLVLAAAGAAGYFLARRALRPVGQLVSQVNEISSQNIAKRLEEPRSQDELAELTRVLNRMLARLEKGLEIQRRFTSDASHEIRTPLSNLQGEIEVALMRPRSPDQYRKTLDSSLEEVNRLTALVEGLLTLTRMDHTSAKFEKERVDLADLVRREVAQRAGDAQERRLDLRAELDGPLNVPGDPTLLARLIANLVDNAIRYCRPRDRIVVRLSRNDTAAVFSVEDTGPGIRHEDQERVFERFFRGKVARSMEEARGAGLGLAICKLIAELHGGAIALRTGEGSGTKVEATFPL
jgi:two-component system OmpR family sensor kinase